MLPEIEAEDLFVKEFFIVDQKIEPEGNTCQHGNSGFCGFCIALKRESNGK